MSTIKQISTIILVSFFSFYMILTSLIFNDISYLTSFVTKAKASELVLTDRLIRLEGVIDQDLANRVNEDLLHFNNKSKKKRIYILINSPGGDLMSGRLIIDMMNITKAPIYCQVVGKAASMAAMILMHCDHKIMLPSSYLLFHQPTMMRPDSMQFREAEVDLKFVKQFWKEVCEGVVLKMGITYEQFYKNIYQDWVLTAAEAKKAGYIDDVVTSISCKRNFVDCDISLYQEE